MTKSVPIVVAILVVGVFIAACGDAVLGQSAPDQPAPAPVADEPTKPASGGDVIRALADELAKLRAQIADLRAAQAAPKPALVAKADDAAPAPDAPAPAQPAPAVAPVADGAAPQTTTVVTRETLIERDVPVYVDRPTTVYVDRDVPVYVDRPVVVERDDCDQPAAADVSLSFSFGHDDRRDGRDSRGGAYVRHDRAPAPQTRVAVQRTTPSPRPVVDTPVVRHERPAPAVVENVRVENLRQATPGPVAESTREPFDPPARVDRHDAEQTRRPRDEEDRRPTHVERPAPVVRPPAKPAPEPTPALPPPPPPAHHKK